MIMLASAVVAAFLISTPSCLAIHLRQPLPGQEERVRPEQGQEERVRLEQNLQSLGFKLAAPTSDFELNIYSRGAAASKAVTVIDAAKREYSSPHVLNDGDGKLSLSEKLSLPKNKGHVVVTMTEPRADVYSFLNKLADHPDLQVIIHCTKWEQRLDQKKGHETLAPIHPKWILIVDPTSAAGKGTEHVKYLEHLTIFWDQLADINFFMHDDAADQTFSSYLNGPYHVPKISHFTNHSLYDHITKMVHAKQKPNFMYLGGTNNPEMPHTWVNYGYTRQTAGNSRCSTGGIKSKSAANGEFYNMTFNEVFQDFEDHCLLKERIGHIPIKWDFQYSAHFAVSRSRVHEVMPTPASYGRIIKNAVERYSWCDIGANFEQSWPLLFSYCDDGMIANTCQMDRGSCSQKKGWAGSQTELKNFQCTHE